MEEVVEVEAPTEAVAQEVNVAPVIEEAPKPVEVEEP